MSRRYGSSDCDESRDVWDRLIEKIDDSIQALYNNTINRYIDEKKRKIIVNLDSWDTWSLDHTLSYIIAPALKQLKDTKHGAPFVDDEDVPEHLRSTSAPPKENEWDTDDFHFDRWDWVLDEMIWSFSQKARDDWESDYYDFEDIVPNPDADNFAEKIGIKEIRYNKEGTKTHQKRMTNGFRLFGKYYEALWD